MAALTPRTYAAPDDETAFRIADGILGSNLNHHYNDDAAFVVKQPKYSKEVQDAIEESRAVLQAERFESYRTRRGEQTPWFWDFLNGVRPAWSPVEALMLEERNAVIDREELDRRIKHDALRLVTIDLVDLVREEQIRRLKAYGDAIAAALKWNRPTVMHQPESADAATVQISEALDRLTAPLPIWKEETDAVYNAVHLVRIEMGRDVLRIGEITGHSASMVFETAIDRLVGYWESCEAVSAKSAKGVPYTHFEPAVQLFVNGCIKSLPNANDLYAAVENEYVTTVARLSLITPGITGEKFRSSPAVAPEITPPADPSSGAKPFDAVAGTTLIPSLSELQQLKEFAHGLTGEQESVVFTFLLLRLEVAASGTGLPVKATVADIAKVIEKSMALSSGRKFSTWPTWSRIQRDLNTKLRKTASNWWSVSSSGGAHLKRVITKKRRTSKRKRSSPRTGKSR